MKATTFLLLLSFGNDFWCCGGGRNGDSATTSSVLGASSPQNKERGKRIDNEMDVRELFLGLEMGLSGLSFSMPTPECAPTPQPVAGTSNAPMTSPPSGTTVHSKYPSAGPKIPTTRPPSLVPPVRSSSPFSCQPTYPSESTALPTDQPIVEGPTHPRPHHHHGSPSSAHAPSPRKTRNPHYFPHPVSSPSGVGSVAPVGNNVNPVPSPSSEMVPSSHSSTPVSASRPNVSPSVASATPIGAPTRDRPNHHAQPAGTPSNVQSPPAKPTPTPSAETTPATPNGFPSQYSPSREPSPTSKGASTPSSVSSPVALPTPVYGPSVGIPSIGSPPSATSNNPQSSPSSVTPSPVDDASLQPASSPIGSERPHSIDNGSLNPTPIVHKPTSGSVKPCETNNGNFGSVQGDMKVASFGYELETTPLSSDQDLTLSILPSLEAAFNDFLVPVLFPECNQATRRLLSKVASGSSSLERRLTLEQFIGMTAKPDDLPIQGVSCQASTDNPCWVIRGEIGLYFASTRRWQRRDQSEERNATSGHEEDRIRRSLQRAMELSIFVRVHSNILRVSYVNLTSLETQGEDDPTTAGATASNTDTNSSDGSTVRVQNALLISFVVAAATGTVLLGLLISHRRRHRAMGPPDTNPVRGETSTTGTPSVPTNLVVPTMSTAQNQKMAVAPVISPTETAAPSDASAFLEGSTASHEVGGGGWAPFLSPTAAAAVTNSLRTIPQVVDSLCGTVDDAVGDEVEEKEGSPTNAGRSIVSPAAATVGVPAHNNPPPSNSSSPKKKPFLYRIYPYVGDDNDDGQLAYYYNLQSPTDDSIYLIESDGSRDAEARSLQN